MIRGIPPILQALTAACFTWGVTALGASLVFVMKHQNKKLLDGSLGFAAGVMTAASFWSLLVPALESAEESLGKLAFLPVAAGFALGAAFVHFADKMLPSCILAEANVVDALAPSKTETELSLMSENNLRYGNDVPSSSSDDSTLRLRNRAVSRPIQEDREIGEVTGARTGERDVTVTRINDEYRTSWRRILLLIIAVTLHNIPEGLAVGVGFGSVGSSKSATFESAFNLALGIGLQNFPEGLAVSLPLAAFGHSKFKAFMYGQLSGMVEPIAALFGAAAVMIMTPVLPYALAFAAGAMIYVVVDDIIPEAQNSGNGKLASIFCIIGFIVMMCLDVGLG